MPLILRGSSRQLQPLLIMMGSTGDTTLCTMECLRAAMQQSQVGLGVCKHTCDTKECKQEVSAAVV